MRALWNILARATAARDRVGKTPADVVHRENKWRLLRYRARRDGIAHSTPIVMVPSLINRHYVLDLMPGKSFVEFLVNEGHDVFMLDWGTPSDEDRFLTFDDVCNRAIARALRVATREAGTSRAHLLGYCLGGTLAVIHASCRPERIASLVTLAAPIDFHDDGLLSTWARTRTFDVDALVNACGNVPWPLMQASFHLLRPTLNLGKAVTVFDRFWDDSFLDGFFALETWGNDNVSFPGECYREYIGRLYRDNALLENRFTLSGEPAMLANIHCPLLAVTFEHDSIVPATSSRPLVDRVSSQHKRHLHLNGGHVGAVVSRKAVSTLWKPLHAWWSQELAVAADDSCLSSERPHIRRVT